MSDDPMKDQLQRNMLEFHCGHTLFCPSCGTCLDAPRAVSLDAYGPGDTLLQSKVVCAPCYDEAKDRIEARMKERGLRLEVSDGRVLWPKS